MRFLGRDGHGGRAPAAWSTICSRGADWRMRWSGSSPGSSRGIAWRATTGRCRCGAPTRSRKLRGLCEKAGLFDVASLRLRAALRACARSGSSGDARPTSSSSARGRRAAPPPSCWPSAAGRCCSWTKPRFPGRRSAASTSRPRAPALLDRLGVLKDVDAAGAQPLRGMRIVAPDGTALEGVVSHGGPVARLSGPRDWPSPAKSSTGSCWSARGRLPVEVRERHRVTGLLSEGGSGHRRHRRGRGGPALRDPRPARHRRRRPCLGGGATRSGSCARIGCSGWRSSRT